MAPSCVEQPHVPPVARETFLLLDRDGKELPNISARRYFCLQCHIPQYDATPLVGNSYEGPKSGGAK